jgi:hypothetical protein
MNWTFRLELTPEPVTARLTDVSGAGDALPRA